MHGYISGYTDTDIINYCPKCGGEINTYYGDGTGKCDNCGLRFGVVECEEEEYESIEAVANKLQSESARQCDQKTREAQKYHYGYIQGAEDLLKAIRRSE